MTSKKGLQNEDIPQEFILDSDDHKPEYEDISSPQSNSGKEEDNRTETGCSVDS
jgi:hypothetical protein